MKKVKKVPVKFTYTVDEVCKRVAAWYSVKKVAFINQPTEEGVSVFRVGGKKAEMTIATLCKAMGGIGGYYHFNGYVSPRINWVGTGKNLKLTVWKDILTRDELEAYFRQYNVGFGDKGNPEVLVGVKVYSPSLSHWNRWLWDCPIEDRSYRCFSNAEVHLEVDPSAGLTRHPHNVHISMRGDSMHGGESLLRAPDYWDGWVVEYCYIEGKKKTP